MTASATPAHTGPLPRWWSGPAYGLLGLPLAFVALPLYVVLPHNYATTWGVPLASVGALLMLVRLLDAVVEPLLGRLSDRLYQGPLPVVLWVARARPRAMLPLELHLTPAGGWQGVRSAVR